MAGALQRMGPTVGADEAMPSASAETPAAIDAIDYGNAFAQEILFSGQSRADGEGPDGGPRAPVPPPPVASDAGVGGGLPVRVNLTVGAHTQTQTANLSPYPELFGISTYGVRPTRVASRTAPDHVLLDIEIGVETPWNVQSRGRTDIPSAESPLITRSTFAAIGNDLRPQGVGRPRRERYWVQHISERHERFHGTDDYSWTRRWPGAPCPPTRAPRRCVRWCARR
jgi:hypothetical protein